jgi:hypothetical protein
VLDVRYITALFIALALQGCAGTPHAPEAGHAHDVRTIAWTRGVESAPYLDASGVCHTFSRDDAPALHALGAQVQACFDGSLPLAAGGDARAPAAVRVVREIVRPEDIDALFSRTADRSVLHAAGRRRHAALFSVRGFYEYRGDTCRIVVAARADIASTVGHEFKHCVDGEFHDERGVWRRGRAG